MKTKGLAPKDRKLAVKQDNKKLTANQWQNTPQQNYFMHYWLEPTSPTFSNAYQSALKAGYKESYAVQIASPAVSGKWIQDWARRAQMQGEHLEAKLIQMINGIPNSKSPDDTKVKAIELMAKLTGKIDRKGGSTTNILVQPILSGASLQSKREVITVDQDTQVSNELTVDTLENRVANKVDTLIPE